MNAKAFTDWTEGHMQNNKHIDAAVMIYKSEIFLFNLNQKKL